MYEVNGVKYDENVNTNKANTEQGWNTQEQQPYMGTQRNKRMQDKYHKKYKDKYNDTYTDKWKKETKHNKTNK